MKYNVKINIEVTDEDIENILSAAFQGMTYWCDEVKIHGFIPKEDNGIWTSQALTRGYRIGVHDSEEEKYYQLTLKKLLNGIALNGRSNFDEWDMYDSEQVIQLALFGKLVYA